MATPVAQPIEYSNVLVVGQSGKLWINRKPGTPSWSSVNVQNIPPGMTAVVIPRVTTGPLISQNPSAYVELTGIPTQAGMWMLEVVAAADGAPAYVLAIPVGVAVAPQVDTTQAATALRFNISTNTLYSPVTPESAVLRMASDDRMLIGLFIEDSEGLKRMPWLSLIEVFVVGDDSVVRIAAAQPVLRGTDGKWSYQVILDLTEAGSPGITECISGAVVGSSTTALLRMQVRLHYFRDVDGDQGPDLLAVTSMPALIQVSKLLTAS